MKILTDEQINDKLEQIQPEGFCWTNPTKPEMVKFKALLQTQIDQDRAEHVCGLEQLASAYDVLFRTRQAAREWIKTKYGYIAERPDLQAEPHGWRMPKAVKVKIVEESHD